VILLARPGVQDAILDPPGDFANGSLIDTDALEAGTQACGEQDALLCLIAEQLPCEVIGLRLFDSAWRSAAIIRAIPTLLAIPISARAPLKRIDRGFLFGQTLRAVIAADIRFA
jgi:hypothetical protein